MLWKEGGYGFPATACAIWKLKNIAPSNVERNLLFQNKEEIASLRLNKAGSEAFVCFMKSGEFW